MDRIICFLLFALFIQMPVSANVVFQVRNKFTGDHKSLSDFKAHDSLRHRRILAADLPIGGDSSPNDAALYFTEIEIGTPPKKYHVQVDTGSDILWVNCVGCENCPKKSSLGIALAFYDPKSSTSSKRITCAHEFCRGIVDPDNNVCSVGKQCSYTVRYGDGSATKGYFVRDTVRLDRVSGNLQTASMNGSITFGCGAQQFGDLRSSRQALDGILGFGQSNSSILSQLSKAKKFKKTFSHCLARSRGGGIFAIGEVVHPKVNNTSPIMPNEIHYTIGVEAIKVGTDGVTLPEKSITAPSTRGAIIDSGTTLAYFPGEIFTQILELISANEPEVISTTLENTFKCYSYRGNVDDAFPIVTFHFVNSLQLKVYPHQYFFQVQNGDWCIGFVSNESPTKQGNDQILLGDIVLADKLVTYNVEDQTIGWIDYDCSSSIMVKDEETGRRYQVGSHSLPVSSSGCKQGWLFVWVVFVIATKLVMYF